MSAMTLVCPCGMTLKAPGARPGRVGKCPRCGGLLRVPDGPEASTPAGYGLDPVAGPSTFHGRTTSVAPAPSRPGSSGKATAEEGPFPPPKGGDLRLGQSLSYPLWSWSSVAMLVFLPPALAAVSAPLPFLVGTLFGGTAFSVASLVLIVPGALIGVCVWGYTLVYLGNVLVTSALGEALPPRPPNLGEEDILRVLGRWAWAVLVGLGLGAVPAVVYWLHCGEIDWGDRLMFVNLAALGAAYAQMALLAVLLYDDPLAANPITVLRAIHRVGWDYAGVCFLSGAFLALMVFQLFLIARVDDSLAHIAFSWLFWANFLFGAMVVLRRLGLFCHRHEVVLDWFPDRPTWGR